MSLAEIIAQEWRSRLQQHHADQSSAAIEAVVQWLVGEDVDRFEQLDAKALKIARQAMEYRYRIFIQRYWTVSGSQGHRNLLKRLSSLFLIRSKIRTWVSLSRDRQRSVTDVLQEVIQEMLQSDRHLQQQVIWIRHCTPNSRLRNALVLASIEEYCLRPIRSQPLLVYRFVNYLRRSQRSGLTQVPTGDLVRMVSDEVTGSDEDNAISLLDVHALANYQQQQDWEEQQLARSQVKAHFRAYLESTLDETAARWLDLYLQGHTQDAIAQLLDLDIRQVYRLREKVSYHAIRVFTLKDQPELVLSWLKTSLVDHSLGLTPAQWQQYWDDLTPTQQQLIMALQAGRSLDAIAQEMQTRPHQVSSEWAKLYLAAQTLRSAS